MKGGLLIVLNPGSNGAEEYPFESGPDLFVVAIAGLPWFGPPNIAPSLSSEGLNH
jgi:hypothetical protein